jgi:hypothetical protein
MPKPPECGLRFSHGIHELIDGSTCQGVPWPKPYHPHHRGLYKPEPGWIIDCPCSGEHRREGPAVIARVPPPVRPRMRLGWPD